MAESTTRKESKADQCRQNALNKSQQKRQAVLDTISDLQRRNIPITKKSVTEHANVSYPFLSKHIDLLQAIHDAATSDKERSLINASNKPGKNFAISVLQRQVEQLKQQVKEKEAENRGKQREIDQLYGKLASRSELTDAEIRRKLAEVLDRLQAYENE